MCCRCAGFPYALHIFGSTPNICVRLTGVLGCCWCAGFPYALLTFGTTADICVRLIGVLLVPNGRLRGAFRREDYLADPPGL